MYYISMSEVFSLFFHLCNSSFKDSVAESSQLFQCFPALGAFVLDLAPVKQWHSLEIVNHIPADQCLMALLTNVKDVTETDQVGIVYGAVRSRV